MKQELKISIGSSLQKAATCLTVAAVIAALGFTFSCSSDNDYEEPWLDKEHKTRAGNSTYLLETHSFEGKTVRKGSCIRIITSDDNSQIALNFSWTSGTVGPGGTSRLTVDFASVPSWGPHIFFANRDIRWDENYLNIIKGHILIYYYTDVYAGYIPFDVNVIVPLIEMI